MRQFLLRPIGKPGVLVVGLITAVCCFVPTRSFAQSRFAGTRAGEERGPWCWCPPGTFKMGSPKTEPGRGENEDQVEVTLTRGFWMGKYEVTQSQYQSVMGENPSRYKGGSCAVEGVQWTEAKEFCRKLTAAERNAGRLPAGWEYRLPTEAQWEYACRAGSKTAFSFGDDVRKLGDYAWYLDNRSGKTCPVGKKLPNRWGLHDMHGNACEWCRDSYQDRLIGRIDPEVSDNGMFGVIRGGDGLIATCRSAYRSRSAPADPFIQAGFRVAIVQLEPGADR